MWLHIHVGIKVIIHHVSNQGPRSDPCSRSITLLLYLILLKWYPTVFSAVNLVLAGFPLTNTLGENLLLVTKTCLTFTFVTQQPFGIPYWNLDTCISVASAISIFHHTVMSVTFLAVLPQYVVMYAMSPMAIASIQAASTANSIHRG